MNLINFLATNGVTCGTTTIGGDIVGIIRTVYNGIRIGIPIILIIVGMIGMGKAIAQQKEDEIKKAQTLLVKQAVAAVIVFLMFSLVSLVMGVLNLKSDSSWACVSVILKEPKDGDTCKTSDNKDGSWKETGTGEDKVWTCN